MNTDATTKPLPRISKARLRCGHRYARPTPCRWARFTTPFFLISLQAEESATSTHFAVAVLLSTVLVAFLAPLLGAYADSRGRRNTLFKLVGFASIIGTLVAFARDSADWRRAGDCDLCGHYQLAHSCKHTNFYDSYISLLGSIDQNYRWTIRSGLGAWLPGRADHALCRHPRCPGFSRADRQRAITESCSVRGCVILRRILFVRIRQSAKRHAGNKSVLDVSDRVQNASENGGNTASSFSSLSGIFSSSTE